MTLCLENETNENKLGRLENQVVLNLKKKKSDKVTKEEMAFFYRADYNNN